MKDNKLIMLLLGIFLILSHYNFFNVIPDKIVDVIYLIFLVILVILIFMNKS